MLKRIFTNVAIIAAAASSAYFLAGPIQIFYCAYIDSCSGGFFGYDLSIVLWISYTYAFLTTFLLMSVGNPLKYWGIGVALAPPILFEAMINLPHIYVPAAIALVAWGLGTLANKALWKLAPSFMAKLQ